MMLRCLKCKAKLIMDNDKCSCSQCGAEWPVNEGIPRFFDAPSHYWGEISRLQARELLTAARAGSWTQAVRSRLAEQPDMISSVLDLQRASWLPMLGLDQFSIALDLGSGYGAITHAISRSLAEVYSVEAIPERIEFTCERLKQENIKNVHLIQASATSLPFSNNSFDLVVLNGVLEWVGEWDLEGSPRTVQSRLLTEIARFLKDDGLLVIGIENRIGYDLLLGEKDHSGISFTSLVPRPIASLMLRYRSHGHHRTQLNSKREYRTYTYTKDGYTDLIKDSGFAAVSCYWATPGYNQPYQLVPLRLPQWIRELSFDLLDHPSRLPRGTLRRCLKRFLAHLGLLQLVLPEFVLIVSKQLSRSSALQVWMKDMLKLDRKNQIGPGQVSVINWWLRTNSFASKSVIRLADPATGEDAGYLKACIGPTVWADSIETEITNVTKIRNSVTFLLNTKFDVPRPLGTLRVGNILYSLESVAKGTSFSRIVYQPGYFADERRVESDFLRVIDSIIEMTKCLQSLSSVRAVNADWLEPPREFKDDAGFYAAIEQKRHLKTSSGDYAMSWTQHGDLSVENIFLDLRTGKSEVIDWADLASGLPPLYDLFSLFLSTGYLTSEDQGMSYSTDEERWIASFRAIFVRDTSFARTTRSLILYACERLNSSVELIPALLLEFLIVRCHYHKNRSPVQRRVCVRLIEAFLQKNCALFGRAE